MRLCIVIDTKFTVTAFLFFTAVVITWVPGKGEIVENAKESSYKHHIRWKEKCLLFFSCPGRTFLNSSQARTNK